jgi:uncharacterized protein YbgA (DUF1722 family)
VDGGDERPAAARRRPFPRPAEDDVAGPELAIPAARGRHVDVLRHLAGLLRSAAASRRRRELVAPIDGYELGRIPRFLPLMLLHEVLTRHRLAWARSKTYLEPCPLELMLRDPT